MAMPPSGGDGYLGIDVLARAYRQGLSPVSVISIVFNLIEAYSNTQPAVWIHLNSRSAVLAAAKSLEEKYPDRDNRPALYGIPFSIKDSIDIACLPTTTACPPLTRYPTKSAPVFASLVSAGALFIGKTNLEQLATGMTGCRSPYGTLHSKFHPSYIVGGSSSGSCVSVGANLVSFSIGSDTAGSGRLPAAFNGVVGWKPTKGTVSCVGITPACQSQDCVAVLARKVADTKKVWEVIRGFDPDDVYAKAVPLPLYPAKPRIFRFGIPPAEALAVCSPTYRRMFDQAVKCIQGVGWDLHPFDWTPFDKAGKLLYEGTFVAERVAGLPEGWLETNASALHPVIRTIFEGAAQRKSTAIEVFRDMHAQQMQVFVSKLKGPITYRCTATPERPRRPSPATSWRSFWSPPHRRTQPSPRSSPILSPSTPLWDTLPTLPTWWTFAPSLCLPGLTPSASWLKGTLSDRLGWMPGRDCRLG